MEKNKLLFQHNAFTSIRASIVTQLGELGEFVSFDANKTICSAGDLAEELFFLIEGFVDFCDAEGMLVIKMTEKQGYFGWNEYEPNYAFTVKTTSDSAYLFKINKSKLLNLFQQKRQFKARMFLYRVPLGVHQFFRTFNIPDYNLDKDSFLTAFEIEHKKSGEIIVKQEEEADKFYMISIGSASVSITEKDERRIVSTLNRGQYFGELALIKKIKRSATVTATSEISLISLSKMEFDKFLSKPKGRLVLKYMLERINSYNFKFKSTIIGTAENCKPRLISDKIAPQHIKLTRAEDRGGSIHFSIKPLSGKAQYKTFVNKQILDVERDVNLFDEVVIGDYKLVLDYIGGFSLQKIDYYRLHVEHLYFSIGGKTILSDISFDTESGDIISIMGPSGSGKSTLLDMIYGAHRNTGGAVIYNNNMLHNNLDFYRNIFGFVPQDDILFSELSIYQNLYITARIREPLVESELLERKIDFVLFKLKLLEQKHNRVGSVEEKGLSGGQRKRVNIARELIFDPHVLFLDEPTSGLSSKDSEDIILILKNLAEMGKMIFVVMHQPSSKIYSAFTKIIFLDLGGKLVFFGKPLDCIKYMKESIGNNETEKCPNCHTTQPEILFDVLEEQDENNVRKRNPQFWAERFKKKQNADIMFDTNRNEFSKKDQYTSKIRLSRKEHLHQFLVLLKRVFLIKKNNLSNLVLTFAAPIIIALLLSLILASSEDGGKYTFHNNKLIIIYLFVGVIFSIFLGLTNSVRAIVSEKAIYNLEYKNRLQIIWYVLSKFFILSIITAIQTILFVIVGNSILEIRGVFFEFTFYLFLVSILGISFGLFLSSIVNSSETVVNWIPMILIPQIILGGALIKFEDMSRDLFLNEETVIPEIGQIIPSRWAHEAMVIAQIESNPHNRALIENREKIKLINNKIEKLLASSGQNEVDNLRRERNLLNEKRGKISKLYPTEIYRNKSLQEAAFNGLGTYASTKYEWLGGNRKSGSFLFIDFYTIPDKSKVTSVWNDPFYSQLKGFAINSTYIEIKTSIFNSIVLLFMTLISLISCIISLKIRDLKGV